MELFNLINKLYKFKIDFLRIKSYKLKIKRSN
jgi:hypothetical protein